jgi:minor histocompatibility antigen H13
MGVYRLPVAPKKPRTPEWSSEVWEDTVRWLLGLQAPPAADDPDAPPPPYQRNAVAAYAVGLVAAFAANELVRRGQPALLYLVPATLGSALLTAAHRNELRTLLAFEAPDSET